MPNAKAIQNMDATKDKSASAGPSSSTFSRARGKLDIFAMFARQWEWRRRGFCSQWVNLCHSARHITILVLHEFMMTLQQRDRRD